MTLPIQCGDSSPSLYELSHEDAVLIFPLLARHVAAASIHHPFLDVEGFRSLVVDGAVTLFIATTDTSGVLGFAGCEVLQYPRHRVANVLFAGGDRGFLEPLLGGLLEMMEAWGRARGATHLSMAGRPGWLRVLKGRSGWTVSPQAFAHRELTGVQGRQHKEHDQHRHHQSVGPGTALPHWRPR